MSRGLIEARGGGGPPLLSTLPFSAVMSRGLIEAARPRNCAVPFAEFSAVMSRGLIEATARRVRPVPRASVFSAVMSRGLIEAAAAGSPASIGARVLRGDEPRPH